MKRIGLGLVVLMLVSGCAMTNPIARWRGPSQDHVLENKKLKAELRQTKVELQMREKELQAKRKMLRRSLKEATRWEKRTHIYRQIKKMVNGE